MGTLGTTDAFTARTFDDTQSYETISLQTAINFLEDFIGAGHTAGFPSYGSPTAGYPWCKKIVGSATAALVSNASGGVAQLALAATSEAEEATLAWNDNLSVDVTKRAQAEFRIALTVPPSAASVEAVWGLSSAWVSGPDTATRLIEFGCTANGKLNLRLKDTGSFTSIAAVYPWNPSSQITLDTAMHMYRIDVTNAADIGFWFDGQRVNAAGSVAFTTTGANAILQPYMSVYKPSGTGLATLQIDKVDLGWMRQ